MLTSKQIERMLAKLERFEETLEPMIFQKVGETGAVAYETAERLHSIPDSSLFAPVEKGWQWGGEGAYCWFKAEYTVPDELESKNLFIRPHTQGYESLLWVNGEPFGTFNTKIVFTGHGNHYCDLLKMNAKAGEKIDIAVEVYAGHLFKGCAPLEEHEALDYIYTYGGIDICVKDYAIQDFYFDLRTVNQMAKDLPQESFRRADAINALYKVHNTVYYSAGDVDKQTFIAAVAAAAPYLKQVLAVKNGEGAPKAALIGHSHMDTAWLWHIPETVKKCARTYSNQVALMQEYPEYKFIQSSACHSDMIRENYPSLFKTIQGLVAQGKYEPNGGVWVECDCNITSGESMVRQFLWGQRFTRKYFNFTSNCFWLPDTFGYSAAIPQIMKGCGVDYFLTTKISWNDTNKFPIDTFKWQGIDGTQVFTHFNRTHCWPDFEDIYQSVVNSENTIFQKTVNNMRCISYGYGDGGGGPQYEMLESARRVKDLSGCPKAEYMLVGDFMKELESKSVNPDVYAGELYLELHRGTLTNQHNIKRNNRKAELALRDAEYFTVSSAVKKGEKALTDKTNPLYKLLLINQFHDILPGTCINAAHVQSLKETGEVIASARKITADIVGTPEKTISVTNTLSFDRSDALFIECEKGYIVSGEYKQQSYTDLDGKNILIVSGVTVPAFSSVDLTLIKGEASGESEITLEGDKLSTPFAQITFDKKGYISSFIDKRADRQLAGGQYPLGTFLIAEDLPRAWDNWDVDADIESKFVDMSALLSREVVSLGKAAAVIRSKYSVSAKSTVTQDVIFFADSVEVRYDTVMDWQDDHRFLKAAFDTTVHTDFARFEIQFGNVKRPTTRNNSIEKAKFEVVNHKYTDISEPRYGVSVLNDSKYAITAEGGSLRLSLHKGGCRPDHKGDKGVHRTVYSFLPHTGGFCAEKVIRPAYELNIPAVIGKGGFSAERLIVPEQPNIIVESIKPCEDGEKAFIARLYEAEGAYTHCPVELFAGAEKVEITNMLEEPQQTLEGTDINLEFRAFEIKTLKISY